MRASKQVVRPGWAKWYREARAEMSFRYGIKGVPVDLYKAQHSLGCSPYQGVRNIYKNDVNRWETSR